MKAVVQAFRVHLIKASTGLLFTGKCGAEAQRQALKDPMPAEMTGWHGHVTCSECLS